MQYTHTHFLQHTKAGHEHNSAGVLLVGRTMRTRCAMRQSAMKRIEVSSAQHAKLTKYVSLSFLRPILARTRRTIGRPSLVLASLPRL
jgi:hypothetical protein